MGTCRDFIHKASARTEKHGQGSRKASNFQCITTYVGLLLEFQAFSSNKLVRYILSTPSAMYQFPWQWKKLILKRKKLTCGDIHIGVGNFSNNPVADELDV